MKKTLVMALACAALCGTMVFADGFLNGKSSFGLSVDAAYYPKSDETPKIKTEQDNDFAPLTGAYSGLEGRVTGKYRYTIPCPIGNSALTAGNTLVLGGNLEITPVSILPQLRVEFTPIAFLKFSSWAQIGTAWNIGDQESPVFQGLGKYNSLKGKYESVDSFSQWYYEWGIEGLFQFDAAALWPGDWHHIVCMALYDVDYKGMTGMGEGDVYNWQTGTEKVNGWYYYGSVILGYQMPLVVQTVGVQFEWQGYYDNFGTEAGKTYKTWDPYFDSMSVNPIAIFKFSEKDSLTMCLNFQTRRNYDVTEVAGNSILLEYPLLKTVGSEWYFRRVAFSYSHWF